MTSQCENDITSHSNVCCAFEPAGEDLPISSYALGFAGPMSSLNITKTLHEEKSPICQLPERVAMA